MPRPGKDLIFLLVLSLLSACGSAPETNNDPQNGSKIAIDLSRLNNDGLQGPPDGLRALHYEFCIPADSALATQVLGIDSTLQLIRGSGGRTGCGENEFLCLGNTHQPEYSDVLTQLARLSYVDRIQESFFEH